ncbi:MAG: hypothetical protein HY028_04890 [Gammaproteobacteria bacterium]|nr:hypothetical protein [Gammaproteobacteria bacterium]
MAQTVIDDEQLKEAVKSALTELFQERKDLFRELVAEMIEEVALAHAIKEGEASEPMTKSEIFKILEGNA